jgi:two-component system, OmpR family, phosphate regulon sensor histidine kinase PhoR
LKKSKSTIWLISLSLVSLAAFLGYYVYSVYSTEKERIEREMGYIFANSIKEMESNMLNSIIKVSGKGNNNISINLNHVPSEKTAVFTSKIESSEIKSDGKKRVVFSRKVQSGNSGKEVAGMISMMVKVDNQSNQILKLERPQSLAKILPTIKKQYAKDLTKGHLNNKFEIFIDSVKPTQKVLAVYSDIATNQKLKVISRQTFWDISKKILPQVLTTILLFGFVALSFFLLIKSNQKSQEMFQLKSDFISNMTHELKTPIATMSVALEAIESFEIKNIDQKKEYLGIARSEVKRLGDLVDRVMDISKMTDLEFTTQTEKTNLNDLIESTLKRFEIRLQNKNIHVVFEKPEHEIVVNSDSESLRTILENLIDNAIKYNQNPDPKIFINATFQANNAAIEVIDNGNPIPEGFRANIFEKFFRVPESGQKHNIKGHGLGLFIVDRLAKSLGYKIEYSAKDQGNSFILKNIKVDA